MQQPMNKTQELVYTALSIALVFVCTKFVNIQIFPAQGGLVHLGNVPLFIIAVLYGRRFGAIAGGVGMAIFDLVGGWFIWAPFTLVVVALMGYTVGAICETRRSMSAYIMAMTAACLIKVVGYYIAEIMIYGNWLAPVASIPGNLVQIGIAVVIVLPILAKFGKLSYSNKKHIISN